MGSDTAPASVDQTLASPGRPLEPALQQDMEQRFGHDFSRVRVHSGTAAQQSAQDVNAIAYTVGHNIVFGADQFAPGTHEGRRLLAHELAHVVQQSGSGGIHVDSTNEKRGPSPIPLEKTSRNTSDASSSSRILPPSISLSGFGLTAIHRVTGNGAVNDLIQRRPVKAPPKYKGRPRGQSVDEEPFSPAGQYSSMR